MRVKRLVKPDTRFLSLSALSVLAALAAMVALSGQAQAAADLASLSGKTVAISAPLKLDAPRLMAMRPGEKLAIDFPVVGRRTVVFETTTRGLDGSLYWHGSLEGQPRDRVYLKQGKQGLVGAIRFGQRQVAFQQQPDRSLAQASAPAPVAGQAYVLGATADRGVHHIHGHFAALTQAEEGAEIALPLPGGQTEVAIVTSRAVDHDGFVQVHAISRMEGAAAPTVITVGKDAVFGTVITPGGEYQIITRQGKIQLLDPKAAGWAQLRGEDEAHLPEDGHTTGQAADEPLSQAILAGAAGSTAAAAGTTTGTGSALTPLAAGTVNTTITLLMSYSASYVAQWGSEAVARTRLSNIVQLANSAYANSGTGIAFRIVGWSLVRQPDTTPQVNLPAMRADSGNFKGLATLKRSTGAAISVFFAPFNATTSKSNTCGLAYVPGAGSGGLSAYAAQAPGALFAALNDGQHNGYYCETLSLAHELGHNLGNVHDKANSSFTGAFSYSYGKGVAGVFGTVMSYISPRVALFSSPQLSCGATRQPCGSASENVVATMLQTKSVVAAQGVVSKASVATAGFTVVSGWLLNANGTPYTAAATVKPTDSRVSCASGSTGLYTCRVPTGINSVALAVSATGKSVSPTLGSFPVDASANTPVNGTRFYLSAKK